MIFWNLSTELDYLMQLSKYSVSKYAYSVGDIFWWYIYIYIETNFIKFKMTSFFYYFQMESFQFSKFRFHSKGRSFQYASGEPRTNKNNTQVHN